MNETLRPFIGSYVVVYYDDILVYSKDVDSHVEDRRQEEKLYANASQSSSDMRCLKMV